MAQNNRGLWIGIIAIIVVAALGWWWIAANQSVNTTTNGDIATSTAATATTSSSDSSGTSVVDRSGDTVKAIVASLPNASEYESLFTSTGVAGLIGSGGQFTLFVPTNAAFTSLPSGTISNMTATQLKRLVEYSLVSGRAIQPGTELTGAVQAYSGDALNFSDLNNVAMVNSSIVVGEYKASNGVVILINQVLLPPEKSTQ